MPGEPTPTTEPGSMPTDVCSTAVDAPDHAGRPMTVLRRWGTTAWWVVGILLAVSMGFAAVAAMSGLVVPLVLAAVVGALAVPLVDRLHARSVPRPVGALIVIVALVGVLVAAIVVVVRGVVDEAGEIRLVLVEGVSQLDEWLPESGRIGDPENVVDGGADQGRPLLSGAASWLTTIFSSTMAFAIGAFIALFMLYYILVDWAEVRTWLAKHLGVPNDVGSAIIDDATRVVRRGFAALSATSLVTALVIGAAMWLLGLPLVVAVTAITFVTSYVPYLGAIISSAFAFLVALGSGGPREAITILIVILVAQNIIQTIVGNRLTSDQLSLHPLPSIISSVCGVAIAGLLGAMLSAPALALAIAVSRRLRSPEMVPGIDLDGTEPTRPPP